jgi:hypothetical protein
MKNDRKVKIAVMAWFLVGHFFCNLDGVISKSDGYNKLKSGIKGEITCLSRRIQNFK